MNRRALALTLAILFLAPGCAGTDVEEDREEVELEEWNSYYVDSMDDLPTCDSSTAGRLYYIAASSMFYACTSDNGWLYVDLTGPAGPQGEVGPVGPEGQVGVQGETGPRGEKGTDGQNGADGQDGQDATVILPDCELVPWGHCQGSDLSNMDLSNMDLTGIDLRGSTIHSSNLSGAILDHANLANADIRYSNLNEVAMYKTNLRYADIVDCSLVNASLQTVDAYGIYIQSSNISGWTDHRSNFAHSLMHTIIGVGVVFDQTNFQQSMILGDFYDASFADSDFTHASIGGEFRNSTLHGVFRDVVCGYWVGYCDFTNSLLRGDYTGFVFHNTNLTGAELHYGMDLTFADLQNAIVTNETLFDWMNIWHYTTWIDGSVCNENPVNWGASPFTRTCDADGNAIDI
jgi:uncharacterized protein YjbI with pentapeptide repeats